MMDCHETSASSCRCPKALHQTEQQSCDDCLIVVSEKKQNGVTTGHSLHHNRAFIVWQRRDIMLS